MLTLKEKLIFLSKNPSLDDLSKVLLISSDTIIYLDLLYKELQLKRSKINHFLKKIAKDEKNTLEKAFLEIYTGKKHIVSSFFERLYLSKKYKSVFSNYLLKYKRYEDKSELLLNIYYLAKVEGKKCKNVYKYIKKSNECTDILPFYKGLIPEEIYLKYLNNHSLESFCNFINGLEGHSFYKILSEKIFKLSLKNTILIINSITSLDNITLYKYLIEVYYRKNGKFSKFKEYFKIIWVDDTNKLRILFCWLRIFIIKRQFNKFVRLFKYLEGINKEEMVVYRVFYECIKEFKSSNKLRFDRFSEICKCTGDTNPFRCVSLYELGDQFNFNE